MTSLTGAQPASTATPAPTPNVKPGTKVGASLPYFFEFRARYALTYGHTYAVHGRIGQKITKKDVVGLHPATESSIPWMIGHIIPVISETGASDAKMTAFLDRLKSRAVLWHAALYNCNRFAGDIANYLGLATPSHLLMPKEFINEIKSLNKARTRLAADAPLYKD